MRGLLVVTVVELPTATANWSSEPLEKSRLVSSDWSLSALPPKADIRQRNEHVCLVPQAEVDRIVWLLSSIARPSAIAAGSCLPERNDRESSIVHRVR
jgi:hypothetical protein